jgi:Domain of unknown function (DUF4873)
MSHVYDVAMVDGRPVGMPLSAVVLLRSVEIVDSVFDETRHNWTLQTRGGARYNTRIEIAYGEAPVAEGMLPYLGVAVHGLPNQFFITGPDVDGQRQYIAACLNAMARNGITRIEVRRSTQRIYTDRYKPGAPINWRRMRRKIFAAYDLSSHTGVDDEVYDGQAVVRIGDDDHDARIRVTGHIEPIDGRYHWQGMLFADLHEAKLPQRVTVRVGENSAEARVVERTPQGGYSVVGVGAPPFARDDIELAVPVLWRPPNATASNATANTPPTIPEMSSGSRPSAPHRNPAHNPAASTAKPLRP